MDATPHNFKLSDWVKEPTWSVTYGIPAEFYEQWVSPDGKEKLLERNLENLRDTNRRLSSLNQQKAEEIETLDRENLNLKQTVSELHIRNHELIENQSKIEQKARTQQRQYDAKVYAYWKTKAETLASKVSILENETKKVEALQKIVHKLMDINCDKSMKLIKIKRILNESSEPCSE